MLALSTLRDNCARKRLFAKDAELKEKERGAIDLASKFPKPNYCLQLVQQQKSIVGVQLLYSISNNPM